MKNYKVSRQEKIIHVMRQIDENSLQIVVVLDDNGRLCGTVTDGDIRRAILKGIDINRVCIGKIMNEEPHIASLGDHRDKLLMCMRLYQIRQMPIVDTEGRVVQLATLDELLNTHVHNNVVVVMAGGLGSRLGELTKNCPKPLLSVGGRPVLETIVLNFKAYGFTKFVFSVNYKAEMIKDYFKDGSALGVQIEYLQEAKRLGTAGPLGLISNKPTESFIVINGDVLTRVNFEHFLEFHLEQNVVATMGVREYSIQVPYGVVETKGSALLGICEKPVHRHYVSTGMYVLKPEVLSYIRFNECLDMPDLFARLLKDKCKAAVFPVQEYWMDIGQRADLETAESTYKEIFLP